MEREIVMWLNDQKTKASAICNYRQSLRSSSPHHLVIDDLFNHQKLDKVLEELKKSAGWQSQKHTYFSLYVNDDEWQKAQKDELFVQRDSWHGTTSSPAQEFLTFLRSEEFLSFLSRIFNVTLSDINVADPQVNTNYFRMSSSDFVELHADDSPGREICLLLYLNKNWHASSGGEIVFKGNNVQSVEISPLYNRCVLFDPSSEGAEHWVKKLNSQSDQYRYNVTSWYWSE